MSKAAKQSIFILIFLLIGTLGYAGYLYMENGKMEEANIRLESMVKDSEQRAEELNADLKTITDQLKRVTTEKETAEKAAQESQSKATQLSQEIDTFKSDVDKWQRRANDAQKERDKVVSNLDKVNKDLDRTKRQLDSLRSKLARGGTSRPEDEEPEPVVPTPAPAPAPKPQPQVVAQQNTQEMQDPSKVTVSYEGMDVADEAYWAELVKEKAALQVTIEDLKIKLSEQSVEVVEAKQKAADLQIEIDKLKAERDEVVREIKYKTDLINNLSLELARTKNDRKFTADRLEKVESDNSELRDQLKRLVSAKGALEKSIVRLSKDKEKMSKKLEQSESLIQSKIDEIWEIKDNLDQTIRSSQIDPSVTGIELPPIVVSSDGSKPIAFDQGSTSPGFNGQVVSINEDNNFVIVDIGENSGIRLGDTLSVYREAKYIGRLEVIQVRKDIAAADIKDQWSRIQVGDTIR